MSELVGLSPVVVAIVLTQVVRVAPPIAAALGGAIAMALWLSGWGIEPRADAVVAAAVDTSIVFVSVALVVVLGMSFVIMTERSGARGALLDWAGSLPLADDERIAFVTLGIAVVLECLMGAGVSLVVTTPLLLRLLEPRVAWRTALLSMGIMPWGNLGLPTLMGALIAHVDARETARLSALVMAPIFVGTQVWSASMSGGFAVARLARVTWIAFAFGAVLVGAGAWFGPDVAGLAAGATIVAIGLVRSIRRSGALPTVPMGVWPYLALVCLVVAFRGIVELAGRHDALHLHGVQVDWDPLGTPVLPLALACVLMLRVGRGGPGAGELWRRVRRPLTTTFAFLALAQCMVKTGLLAAPIDGLDRLSPGASVLALAVAGGLSGYVTGSNVAANAMVMPSLTALDPHRSLVLAAIQNCAAGLGAMGSLPMIALVLGIAGADFAAERALARFGIAAAAAGIAAVAVLGLGLAMVR